MRPRLEMRPTAAWAGLLFVFAACAPIPPPADESVADFPRLAAREAVAAGYGRIVERYLDTLTVEAVALEGMRGLASLDPSITVARRGDSIEVGAGDRAVGRFKAADPDDVGGWASLTVDVAAASRSASREMRQASVEKIYEAIFDGALANLDIFSRYAGAEEAREHRAKRDGFGGIGVSYGISDGVLKITSIMADTPAQAAGLRVGDIITQIDGESTENLNSHNVLDRLRGPMRSRIELVIKRIGEAAPRIVYLDRALIVPVTVTARREKGILTAQITSFNQNTAISLADIVEAAMAARSDRLRGIVLDMRGNPGGLLKQAIRVADLFLNEGDIMDTQGRHPDSFQHYEATGADIAKGLPLVVLIDGRSASSAEIVAAALQDRGRAIVVGTTSFGKGTVQTVIRTPNDGEITLTWSRLLTPSGYALHGLGVRPNVCTSGLVGEDLTAINRVLTGEASAGEAMRAWRRVGLGDQKTRDALRMECPGERRRDEIENRIADRLITDPVLYAHALDLGSSVAAASP